MAEHARRRARRRRQSPEEEQVDDGFIPALPQDQNWMEALRETEDGGAGHGDDATTALVTVDEWTSLQEALEEQRSLVLALTEKVDAMGEQLGGLAGRLPPADGPERAAPPQTVRDALLGVRRRAAELADRLRTPS